MPKSDPTIGMTSETGDRGVPALVKTAAGTYTVLTTDASGYVKSVVKVEDNTGTAQGVKFVDGKPRVSAMPYLYDIAEGNVANHTPWTKIGYSPAQTAGVNTDIWSYSATQPVYLFPTAAIQMEVTSSSNTDIGTIIHSGTSTGGSLTSLVSAGENFNTTTAIGDCVILDKSGISPEYGFITAIVSDTEITIGGGFSHGGSGSGRAYSILDESATAGGHAVEINYLDGSYAEKREIVILNGNAVPAGVIATVNTDIFRINSFRIIAAGANKIPSGNIFLRATGDTPVYSYITLGFNRARNSMYTVPAGKSLYVVQCQGGFGTTGKASREYARITTRANIDPTTRFKTDGLFYPFTDIISSGEDVIMPLPLPTKLPAKTDIKVSAVTSETGVVTSVLRGWLENE